MAHLLSLRCHSHPAPSSVRTTFQRRALSGARPTALRPARTAWSASRTVSCGTGQMATSVPEFPRLSSFRHRWVSGAAPASRSVTHAELFGRLFRRVTRSQTAAAIPPEVLLHEVALSPRPAFASSIGGTSRVCWHHQQWARGLSGERATSKVEVAGARIKEGNMASLCCY